ncbi:unnamed protein product, partial [Symbiodinium sp. CCMP2456]
AALLAKMRRRQLLSPLVPAEAVLRSFPRASHAALAVQAEHTLTAAVRGAARIWVVRDGVVVARTLAFEDPDTIRSFNLRVRPGDTLGLDAAGARSEDSHLVEALEDDDASAMVLRIELMAAEEVFEPLQPDSPHPSWRHAIFNEYGTHDKKL